ncbi:MAG: multidrug/biocide efflux PACE transporter [Thiomonas delicata]
MIPVMMASIKLDQTPMPPSSMQNKSLQERLLQALGFELLAILLCTPLFSWIMGTSWMRMGALTVASSAIAVLWNMIFNVVFDRLRWRHALPKGMGIDAIWRAAHAVLFEGGLLLITVPLAAWWLGIGFVAAVLLDLGLLLFFLPYTYAYHWAYDVLREKSRSGCG